MYNVPSGTYGVEDTTIDSARYNAFVDDVAQDLNHPRPILAGGTASTNAIDALTALSGEFARQAVVNYNSDPLRPGSIYSSSTATGSPVTNHAFVGIVYQVDANNMVVEVRDQNDSVVPGRLYIREKKAGVWSAWRGSGDEGSSSLTGDMFYGIIGTAPNASFVVNDKADASGSNLLTVRKSDGIIRGNGAVPPGMIMDFGGGTAPVGWLACDGQAVLIASYQELFNAIGATWGWNGSTTFNVPNLEFVTVATEAVSPAVLVIIKAPPIFRITTALMAIPAPCPTTTPTTSISCRKRWTGHQRTTTA